MLVLRDKIFGKLDALEAQKKGISVAELRARRAGIGGTGTVHDSINMKQARVYDGPCKLRADNRAAKRGYTNSDVRYAQQRALEEYKDPGKRVSGKLKSRGDAVRDYQEAWLDRNKKELVESARGKQELRKLESMQKPSKPTTPTPSATQTLPATTPKPTPKVPAAVTPAATGKAAEKGIMGFVKNNKKALGIATVGTTAAGLGLYAYKKHKDKK